MDTEHYRAWRQILQSKLEKQRILFKNAVIEKDRWIYHGNIRYIEGQIDLLIKLIEGKSI